MHYFITFIPIIVAVTGLMLRLVDKIKIKYVFKLTMIIILVLILSYQGYKEHVHYCKVYMTVELPESILDLQIKRYILNNSEETDLVQLIGGRGESVTANFRTKRLAGSKYNYLPLWDSFTKERKRLMVNDLVEEVKHNIPKLILMSRYQGNKMEFEELLNDGDAWYKFLDDNYELDLESIERIYCV